MSRRGGRRRGVRATIQRRIFAKERARKEAWANGDRFRGDELTQQIDALWAEVRGRPGPEGDAFEGQTSRGVVHPDSTEIDTIWRDARK